MTLILYNLDLSPPACGCRMVLDVLNLPVKFVDIDLLKNEHLTPEFLEKNPLHTVPVLEDGDLCLHESQAIMTYLCNQYAKDDSLYPKDPKKRALVDQKLFFDAQFLSRMKAITYQAIFEDIHRPTEKQVKAVHECYGFLDTFLSKSKFITGDTMTIADIALTATLNGCSCVVPFDEKKYPTAAAWFSYMSQQPFYKKYGKASADSYRKFLKPILFV